MRRSLLIPIVLISALGVALLATRGIPPPTPNPPGTFSFAALGDAPYYWFHGETLRYRVVLQEIDAHDLGFVVHVGDIFWQACTDEHYRETLDEFNALRHPVIYIPGDNEWTDCWGRYTGGFEPLGRLAKIREIFYAAPTQSLGARRLVLTTQGGHPPFAEFVEHARWTHQGVVFATVNLPGSWNAGEAFPGRTPAHDEASKHRTEAAAAWLRETFAAARAADATAVVVAFHASPGFGAGIDEDYRRSYEPFLTALEEEVEAFGRPVLAIHGDDHAFTVDHPLTHRTTGRRLENLTRLEVPGSPDIGWVRVVVAPGPETTFAFENRVVPKWKVW